MSGEPAFFEIGVEDPQRGKAFYGELFGWGSAFGLHEPPRPAPWLP